MTAEAWRADSARLQWAQQEPLFRELLAVLINGRDSILPDPAATENRMLGRHEGFIQAVELFKKLAIGIKPEAREAEPTYEPETQLPHEPTD